MQKKIISVKFNRLYLAGMHFYAYSGRQQATTEDGNLRWTTIRPKACKGTPFA